MGSKASEFTQRGRKTVALPSGLCVDIRKLRLIDFVGLGELLFPSNSANSEPAEKPKRDGLSQKEIESYSNRAICAAAISPKFVDDDEGYGLPDIVHVRDLDSDDWNHLVQEIFAFAGITREVAADAESFRNEPIGVDSAGNGAGAAQVPTQDSGAVAVASVSQHGGALPGINPESTPEQKAKKTGS